MLTQTFTGDVRGSLDDFKVKVRRYEPGRVKIAVVQKGKEDENIRRHWLMLATGSCARKFGASLSGRAPMDVSAVYKGKEKGKDKGKWKDKDKEAVANPDAEVMCYSSHHKRHRKRDYRTMEKKKPKKGQPENAFEDAPTQGATASSTQATTSARISMVEMDHWILMIIADDHEIQVGSIERVLVDSGAAVSMCLLRHALKIPMANSSQNATLRNASGAQIEH